MAENACLRPASLSDVINEKTFVYTWEPWRSLLLYEQRRKITPLRRLYNAEWRLRGFERTP